MSVELVHINVKFRYKIHRCHSTNCTENIPNENTPHNSCFYKFLIYIFNSILY